MNAAHIHLLLNHIPLISAAVAILLFAMGVLRRSDDLRRGSLLVFVIAALVSIAVYLSGEPAEEVVEHLPGIAGEIIEQHERAALFSLIAIEVLGLLSLAGLLGARRSLDHSKVFVAATLTVSMVALGLMAWTANLGGQIRHSEIRSGATASPASTERGKEEEHRERR